MCEDGVWVPEECVVDSDCGGCYGCEYGCCVGCFCWDPDTAISGPFVVRDATLCQETAHACDATDTDYYVFGTYPGYPSDSLTHQWTKTAGTNPQTGTWPYGGTDAAHVSWKAPPCTGTVNFKDSVDDVAYPMWMPCDESDTRDDPSVDFEDTATVSLPDGCEYVGSHDSSVHWNDIEDYSYGGVWKGLFLDEPATYDVDFKYTHCKWVCEISNVVAKTGVYVWDPDHPGYVSITQASDVPCDPPSEPLLAETDLTDTDLADDEGPPYTKYWVHHAVIVHELKHRSDWKEFYSARFEAAVDWCELLYRTIDCADATTITCQAARIFWISSINEAFAGAYIAAEGDYNDPSTPDFNEAEQRAYLAESAIDGPIAEMLPEGCGQ